jgi:amidase
MFDAMLGEHPRDPLSLPAPASPFQTAATSGWRPRRVAYSADLGITPVDPQVAAITRDAAGKFAAAGIPIDEAHPDLSEAHECFQVLRALSFAVNRAKFLREHRNLLKPEVIWNIETGLALKIDDIVKAEAQRVALAGRMLAFFDKYDLLLCPATIVPAFPIEQRYLAECAGKKFDNYVEWLAIAYAITLCCCPALSLPCGFTSEKLPVGIQIVAPPRAEARVLAGAKLLEDMLGLRGTTPILPRAPAAPKTVAAE